MRPRKRKDFIKKTDCLQEVASHVPEQLVDLAEPPVEEHIGPQTACLSSSKSVNSRYGRARNAPDPESFSSASPCPAASAEPAHPASAPTRVAQSRSAGNGNESGAGRIGDRSNGGKGGGQAKFRGRGFQSGIRSAGQTR